MSEPTATPQMNGANIATAGCFVLLLVAGGVYVWSEFAGSWSTGPKPRTAPVSAPVSASPIPTIAPAPTAPRALPATEVDLDSEIRAKCAKDWPDDFRMQQFCYEQGREGYTAVANLLAAGEQSIVGKCMKEWRPDYRMVAYCANQQIEARAKVQGR